MAISNIETVGIFLIVIGIFIIFLKLTGKISGEDESGEISSKIFNIKGGSGIVLVALGVILFTLGGSLPEITPTSTPTPTTTPSQTSIPTTAPPTTLPSTTVSPITIPSTTQPLTSPTEITEDYLIGTWSSIQGMVTETIIFYPDYSFYLKNSNTYTGETLFSLSGVYGLTGSGLYLYTGGTPLYYSLTYIDQNTFEIDADIYTRVG